MTEGALLFVDGLHPLTGFVPLALQKKTPETREQAKDFMVLLRELDPPVNGRSRWIKVRQQRQTAPRSPAYALAPNLSEGRP